MFAQFGISIIVQDSRQIVNAADRSQVLVRYVRNQHFCHFVLLLGLSQLDLLSDVSECHHLTTHVVKRQLLQSCLNRLLGSAVLTQREFHNVVASKNSRAC